MEYDEQQQQELREQVERGRKAKIVFDFMKDFLLNEQDATINQLLYDCFEASEQLLAPVLYLRVLRKFELRVKSSISLGEIAEKELSKDGE